MKSLVLLLLCLSCARLASHGSPKEGKYNYSFRDSSGTYRLSREFKILKKKLVSRSQLLSATGDSSKVLEKSISVSQIGSTKNKAGRLLTLRPLASEFTVWLEGKKYFTKMRLNTQKKSMVVSMESPETEWNGTKEVPFPKGRHFCFYSQIPECLYHNHLLNRATSEKNQEIPFYVIWDSFPYTKEQYQGAGQGLFAPASLKFEGEKKNAFRYIIEVDGQIILYDFTKSYDLIRTSWIAQGIMITPPGEEVPEGDAE